MELGFDSDKFVELERKEILNRINRLGGKLYMELGGKIFDDLHASRVLPGYKPNNKVKILEALKDDLEIIICISARDIEKNKVRSDFGITYDMEVKRLIDNLTSLGLNINSVCITLFEKQPSATKFGNQLKQRGYKVYYHNVIDGYPDNIDKIVSDDGYGKNPYIKTTKPLVVVSAPGPGSCKMATCLSQLYHEFKTGQKSGYAKLETFPVWDLPIDHPINIAYEAATADLNDKILPDYYHKNAYNIDAINYNRDLQAFPVLRDILKKITGEEYYKSPTDMGVNVLSKCILDQSICKNAGKSEIIRRYLRAKVDYKKGLINRETVEVLFELMQNNELHVTNRHCLSFARKKQKEKQTHIVAIELHNGKIVYGKNQGVITATAGAVLNALKELANISHENIVNRDAVKNISYLKKDLDLGESLDLKDIFIALSILSETDESSRLALEHIQDLKGCEVHSTCILPSADEDFLRKLKVNLTCDDVFANQNLFE